ncbi:MAG: CoA transferase [Hyphomicrobiales bacterium]|nr:CoA transferase [Hyphomicrobiales bacterium]
MSAPAALPLDGIRVVEFSHMVMGPTCGLILADLGADVIKVEPAPDGDKTRRLRGSGAGFFAIMSRNKRSVVLDLKSREGLDAALRLIRTADVVIENFRPGAMARLGLGYEALKADNPGLIYMSAKGFLQGPYEHRTALDEVVQMMAGLAYMTGPEGRPLRAGSSVNDIMGGMFGVIGILAALLRRRSTGEGSHIESALYENCVFLVAQHMAQYAVTAEPAAPMPSRISAWSVYDVFDTADGQVFVGAVTDTQWDIFCEAFGFDDLAADPELATNRERVLQRDRFMPRIRERFARLTADELMTRCEALGLPYAPIRRPQDLFEDPHLTQSGGLLDVTLADGRTTRVPALPLAMDGRRFGVRRDLPGPGEHTGDILAELGLDDGTTDETAA